MSANALPQGDRVVPEPETAAASSRRRTFLTDIDKLALVRLCVRYHDKYGEGKKDDFWALIRE